MVPAALMLVAMVRRSMLKKKRNQPVDSFNSSEGIEGPPTLPAVGATLVVARLRRRVCRQQGDHKGRPYSA
jgi:hypothetical protein